MVGRARLMEPLEARRLLSFDLAVVDAVTTPGTYEPGQPITVTFTFVNNGTEATPQTRYFAYLVTSPNLNQPGDDVPPGDENGPGQGYGGLLFDAFDGLPLAPIAAGTRFTDTVTLPVGGVVFNGGPYFIYVLAGLGDPNIFPNDLDPSNNFGFSSEAQITIVRGFDGQIPGGTAQPVVGRLDPDFGDDGSGVASSTVDIPNLRTLATVFDPGANVQYALASTGGAEGSAGAGLALLRFDRDGRLDDEYGVQGLLTLPATNVRLLGASLVRSADGALFVAANTTMGSLVVKFTALGSFENGFGVSGVVSGVSVAGGAELTALALLPAAGGGVYVLGSVGEVGSRDMACVRLGADGSPDVAFGTGGSVVIDLGGDDVASVGLVLPDGSVVLAGSSGSRLAAVRVSASGVRDLRFGTRGAYLGNVRGGVDERFTALTPGRSGAIYIGGYSAAPDGSGSAGFVLRLSRTGRPEPAFGRRGAVQLDVGASLVSPNTLLTTPDGGVMVAAQFASSLSEAATGRLGAVLVRLEGRGRAVSTFGTNGVARVFEPGFGPATAGDGGSFADFVASKDGAVVGVPGGKVRSLASQPGTTLSTVKVAQLVADGADVAPVFARPVASSLKPGARSSVQLQVSNLGTLPASGTASMSVSLVPASVGLPGAGGPGGQAGGVVGTANVRLKLNAGQSRNQPVRISVPATAAGLYTVVARLTPSEAVGDIGRGNNAATAPNQVQVGATALRMSAMVLPLSMVRIGPPGGGTSEVMVASVPQPGSLPGGPAGWTGPSVGEDPGATGELFSDEPVGP